MGKSLFWGYSSAGRAFGSPSIVRHIRSDFLFPVFLSDLLDFPLKIEYLRNPKFATFFARKVPIWARSSAGRALRSHRRGRGFDPLRVHQIRNHLSENWGDFSFDHRNTTDGFQKIFGWRVVTLARRPILWIWRLNVWRVPLPPELLSAPPAPASSGQSAPPAFPRTPHGCGRRCCGRAFYRLSIWVSSAPPTGGR